jgi:hypothetical protein
MLKKMISGVFSLLIIIPATTALADGLGQRIENRLDHRGDLINDRLDHNAAASKLPDDQ